MTVSGERVYEQYYRRISGHLGSPPLGRTRVFVEGVYCHGHDIQQAGEQVYAGNCCHICAILKLKREKGRKDRNVRRICEYRRLPRSPAQHLIYDGHHM
jgi:hypothetical protein